MSDKSLAMADVIVKHISDHKIRPIKTNVHLDTRPVKGGHLISDCNTNILLVGRTHSGKSTVLFKLLWECIGKETIVVLFVGTILNDESWIETIAKLKKHGIKVIAYDSTTEGRGKKKVNYVADLIKGMRRGDFGDLAHDSELTDKKDDSPMKGGCADKKDCNCEVKQDYLTALGLSPSVIKNDDPPSQSKGISKEESDSDDNEKVKEELEKSKKRIAKAKYAYPQYQIVFDDMSEELKNPAVKTLLKQARHHGRTIISTQYLLDILPEQRKQIRVFIIFKGQPDEKLKVIYKDADVGMPFEYFKMIYNDAVEEPFSFLYIDKDRQIFRKRFEFEYEIPKDL